MGKVNKRSSGVALSADETENRGYEIMLIGIFSSARKRIPRSMSGERDVSKAAV